MFEEKGGSNNEQHKPYYVLHNSYAETCSVDVLNPTMHRVSRKLHPGDAELHPLPKLDAMAYPGGGRQLTHRAQSIEDRVYRVTNHKQARHLTIFC